MKKLLNIILLISFILALTFTFGCGENKVPTDVTVSENDVLTQTVESTVEESIAPVVTVPTVSDETDTVSDGNATVSGNNNETPEQTQEIKEEINEGVADKLPSNITPMDKTMYALKACNVRDLADDKGNVVEKLAKGDAVHVIGQDNDSKWYQLENGFVSDKYLTDKKPTAPTTTETKPVTTTPSPSTTTTTTTTTPSTPTTPSTTPESTPTPASTACQHKNVIRQVLSITRSCTDTFEYKVICADCGTVINEHLVETAPSVSGHHIITTFIIEQSGICGVQDKIYHEHKQCNCGAINEDGPSITVPQPHSFRTRQFYDAEGNLCEGQRCEFCGYDDPNYTIIQYAEP